MDSYTTVPFAFCLCDFRLLSPLVSICFIWCGLLYDFTLHRNLLIETDMSRDCLLQSKQADDWELDSHTVYAHLKCSLHWD